MGLSHALALVLLATSLLVASASVLKVTRSESLSDEDLVPSDIVSNVGKAQDHQTEAQDLLFQKVNPPSEASFKAEDSQTKSQDLQHDEQTRPNKVFVFMHEKRNWFQALMDCERWGMNLATIRSEDEQKALEQQMENEGVKDENLWLGGGYDLFVVKDGGWAWRVCSHDEPFTYTHWDGQGPNEMDGKHSCLQIRGRHNYFWDYSYCTEALQFVCEDETSLSKSTEEKPCQTQHKHEVEIIAVIPIDILGLSDEHFVSSDIVSNVSKAQDHQTEAQDLPFQKVDLPLEASNTKSKDLQHDEQTRPNKVFVIMHDKVNWFQALQVCEKSGMNLATIRSEDEQKALEQLMANEGVIDEEIWLAGRHDLPEVENGGWTWRVGSHDEPFTYTHWDGGEPIYDGIPQRCVHIRGSNNYFWDDLYCFIHLRFVCENKIREDERSLTKGTEEKSSQTQESSLREDEIQSLIFGLIPIEVIGAVALDFKTNTLDAVRVGEN